MRSLRGKLEPIVDGKKLCSRCGETKPIIAFSKSGVNKLGLKPACKECIALYAKELRNSHPEKIRRQSRESKRRNKDQARTWELRNRHGLEWADYEAMSIRQLGACAICRFPPSGTTRLCVDHNHSSGELRDLLCSRCNLLIGWIEKNPRYAYALNSDTVIDYAKRWSIL